MNKKTGLLAIKTATLTSKGQIAIPKKLRDLGRFAEGERIAILTYPRSIVLRPLRDLEEMYPAIMSEAALAEAWLSKEDEDVFKDIPPEQLSSHLSRSRTSRIHSAGR